MHDFDSHPLVGVGNLKVMYKLEQTVPNVIISFTVVIYECLLLTGQSNICLS